MSSKNITGIVLAGGKSSRMGSDKGMVVLNGKRFIEHILGALAPNVDKVIIVANNRNYDYLGHDVKEDLIKNCGPLAGIYTGLMNSKTEKNMVVSCDIPFITSEFVKYMIENSGRTSITVPIYKGRTEPLCGVYSKNITGKIYDVLTKNELKMRNFLRLFNTREIEITNGQNFYNESLLANINTPQELKHQKELAL